MKKNENNKKTNNPILIIILIAVVIFAIFYLKREKLSDEPDASKDKFELNENPAQQVVVNQKELLTKPSLDVHFYVDSMFSNLAPNEVDKTIEALNKFFYKKYYYADFSILARGTQLAIEQLPLAKYNFAIIEIENYLKLQHQYPEYVPFLKSNGCKMSYTLHSNSNDQFNFDENILSQKRLGAVVPSGDIYPLIAKLLMNQIKTYNLNRIDFFLTAENGFNALILKKIDALITPDYFSKYYSKFNLNKVYKFEYNAPCYLAIMNKNVSTELQKDITEGLEKLSKSEINANFQNVFPNDIGTFVPLDKNEFDEFLTLYKNLITKKYKVKETVYNN